jgi:4-carboxymuconolactone decarboxylase
MVQLAALISAQALSEYRVMLGAALTSGVTPAEVKEIVYQAVPYTEMGKVFDFLHATNDVLTGRGVQLPLGGQATTPDTRARTGRTVQEQIAGTERVKRMYSSAARDERHIQEFLSANCFGDHVARGGIDLPVRERNGRSLDAFGDGELGELGRGGQDRAEARTSLGSGPPRAVGPVMLD